MRQTNPLPSITVAPGLDVSDEKLAEWHAMFYLPGEQVRIDPRERFVGESDADYEERLALFHDRLLTVRQTWVEPAPGAEAGQDSGMVIVSYAFEEVPGIHNAKAFMNPAGYERIYGGLIHRDGCTWLVPLKEDVNDPQPAGEAREILPVMSRWAKWHFGVDGKTAIWEYLAAHDEPSCGEFVIIPRGYGLWHLEASPWTSGCSDKERQIIEQAVDTAVAKLGAAIPEDDPAYMAWTWAVVGLCADANDMRGPEARDWCAAHARKLASAFLAGTDPMTAYNDLVRLHEDPDPTDSPAP